MKRMFTVILAVLVITVVGVAPASASKAQKCERKLARLGSESAAVEARYGIQLYVQTRCGKRHGPAFG
jgi:hypothetical protein